ncbi:hypothetical protein HDZ31DRAFT_42381, partial [Schizophyllum fasciatum]
ADVLPTLNHFLELGIFASRKAPCATVSFADFIDVDEILGLYKISRLEVTPIYSLTDPDARCNCIDQTGRRCNARALDHELGVNTHIPYGQLACPWVGCGLVFPEVFVNAHGLRKVFEILCDHFLLEHNRCAAYCRLCKCPLKTAPYLVAGKDDGLTVLPSHLASGWCLGLAKIALQKGLPVVAPRRP